MHSPILQGPPPPLGPLRHLIYRARYPSAPDSISAARERFHEAAAKARLDAQIAEVAELCLSELTTNAVRHARALRPDPAFHVWSTVTGRHRRSLYIGVTDADGGRLPPLPDPASAGERLLERADAESGRGLLMVALWAHSFGVTHGPVVNGKIVWCSWPLTGADRHTAGALATAGPSS